MMPFPPEKDKKSDKNPAADKKPGSEAPKPGVHEQLMRPGVKPGQGMDPMMAMMMGMGDMSHLGPPAPGAPMGPEGLPVGGGLPSSDPAMDPAMDGSSLFQALTASLDPYASPPEGHGELEGMGTGDPGMGLDQLLAMLALSKAGVGGQGMGINPSGQPNEPTYQGHMMGVQNPNLIY
jgi:hypothetical protein